MMVVAFVVGVGVGVYFAPRLGWVQRKAAEIADRLK
jgi:hypothetical protein